MTQILEFFSYNEVWIKDSTHYSIFSKTLLKAAHISSIKEVKTEATKLNHFLCTQCLKSS